MSFLRYNEDWKSKYLQPGVASREWGLLVDEPIVNVAHLPLLTPEVCSHFIEHAERVGKWTTNRHKNYPTHDILLRDIGLYELWEDIMNEYVHNIAFEFFGLEGDKWNNMVIEPFIVKYEPRVQPQLSFHFDFAHYSTVLALNDAYTGGGTYFWRQKKLVKGKPGDITIHPGEITHKHAARPVYNCNIL